MPTEMLYPIHIPVQEQEIITGILFDRKGRMPALLKKFTEKNNEISLTSFENGFLIGALTSQRDAVPECWKQLIDVMNKIKKDAGVEVTELGNNMVELKDSSGFTIVRQKLDWE